MSPAERYIAKYNEWRLSSYSQPIHDELCAIYDSMTAREKLEASRLLLETRAER